MSGGAATQLAETVQRTIVAGLQAAQAYNQAQAALQLEEVLTPARMASAEGTQASLATLVRMEALTEQHKAMFSRYMLQAVAELNAHVAEASEAEQDDYRARMTETVNWHLQAQAATYTARERWVAAVRGLFELVESRRETCQFEGGAVYFAEDADADAFDAFLEAIEAAHQADAALMQQRLERIGQSAAVLGIGVKGSSQSSS